MLEMIEICKAAKCIMGGKMDFFHPPGRLNWSIIHHHNKTKAETKNRVIAGVEKMMMIPALLRAAAEGIRADHNTVAFRCCSPTVYHHRGHYSVVSSVRFCAIALQRQ